MDLINEILFLAMERYAQEDKLGNGTVLFEMLCLEEGVYGQGRRGA